jgi:polyhydroxyalkanoate synthesis regulator phasin
MPLLDVLQAAVSRPVARVIDSPIREIMETILEDHGYARPEEVESLHRQLDQAESRLHAQAERIEALEHQARGLQAQLETSA